MIMENKTDYICPICIDTKTEYKTECGHRYCKYCLSKIKKCAICRKNLLNTNIYSNTNQKIAFNNIIERIISTGVNSETITPFTNPQITFWRNNAINYNSRSNNLNSIVEIGVPDRYIHDNNHQVSFWSNLLNSFVRIDEQD